MRRFLDFSGPSEAGAPPTHSPLWTATQRIEFCRERDDFEVNRTLTGAVDFYVPRPNRRSVGLRPKRL